MTWRRLAAVELGKPMNRNASGRIENENRDLKANSGNSSLTPILLPIFDYNGLLGQCDEENDVHIGYIRYAMGQ
jgi:hypothetical protein